MFLFLYWRRPVFRDDSRSGTARKAESKHMRFCWRLLVPPLVLFLPATCVWESPSSVTHRLGCHTVLAPRLISMSSDVGRRKRPCIGSPVTTVPPYPMLFCTQLWGLAPRSSISGCCSLFPNTTHPSYGRWSETGKPIAFVGYNSPGKPFVVAVKMSWAGSIQKGRLFSQTLCGLGKNDSVHPRTAGRFHWRLGTSFSRVLSGLDRSSHPSL